MRLKSYLLLIGVFALPPMFPPGALAGDVPIIVILGDSISAAYNMEIGLKARRGHYPSQLSGGEKQRVAIARAFVIDPTVLFADEPTGNLDQRTGETIIDLLFRLNSESSTTLVLITHDTSLASRCDRILHMDAGRIEREEVLKYAGSTSAPST